MALAVFLSMWMEDRRAGWDGSVGAGSGAHGTPRHLDIRDSPGARCVMTYIRVSAVKVNKKRNNDLLISDYTKSM